MGNEQMPVLEPPVWGSVPAEMAQRKQWLLWRFESKAGQKKPAKMPYYCDGRRRGGTQGSDEDRASLATLDQVREAYEWEGNWSGIGFAFLPGDGLIGIDIDGAIDPESGEISPQCQAIIRACNSFTELSPSRKGVHIIVQGTTETNKSNDIGLEVFCGRQFFTVTARRWSDTSAEVREIEPRVLARLHKVIDEAKAASAAAKGVAPLPPARAAQAAGGAGAEGTDDFRRVNTAAMAAVDAWVPTLFPSAFRRGADYRVTSKSLGRDLQEDLVIGPEGIMDWGVHDMGDPRGGKRSPIDLVMEWLPTSTAKEALRWLAQIVGVDVARPAPQARAPAVPPLARDEGGGAEDSDQSGARADKPAAAKSRKPRERAPKPQVDFGIVNSLVEHFALIYGTQTVWDGQARQMMAIGAMELAHGSAVTKMWLASPDRRTVFKDAVVFDPTETCDPKTTINLYDGVCMEPEPCTPQDVAVMLELLRHLCGDSAAEGVTVDEVVHWCLCWLALPLQRRGAKMRTAMVFHGPQGTGKNLFFDAIRKLYGAYGVMVGQTELEDKYNEWLSAKLFIIANEVMTKQELYHNKNKLKAIITDEQISIRPMHAMSRFEANHANLVFLSNESMPLVLEDRDRRYLVVYTPLAEDGDLYVRVSEFLKSGGAEKWLYFLQTYDIGKFDEHTKPIMTAAKKDLIQLGLPPSMRFLAEWWDKLLPVPVHACSTGQLYRVFRRWCDQTGQRVFPNQDMFSRDVTRWGKERGALEPKNGRKEPLLERKVVQIPDPTSDRAASAMWVLRGTGPLNGVTWGDWAKSSIDEFEKAMSRYLRTNTEGVVAPDA